MSEVTSSQDELSEVDTLYRRLSASDPGRPGEWVRRKVQAYAAQQAAERAVRDSAKGKEAATPAPAAAAPAPAPKPAAPTTPVIEAKQTSSKSWLIPVAAGGVIMAGLIAYFAVPHGTTPGDTTAVAPPVPAPTPEPATSQADQQPPAQVAQAPSASEPPPSPPAAQASEPEPPPQATSVAQAPPSQSAAAADEPHTSSPAPAEHTQSPAAQAPAKPRVARQNTPTPPNVSTAQSSPPTSARPEPAVPAPSAANNPAPTSTPVPSPETRQAAVAPTPPPPAPAPAPTQTAPTPAPAATAAPISPPEDFYRAAESGDLAKLKDVLETNVDVNALDPKGHTALILAIQRGRTDTVKLLLAHGANPNQPDAHGTSPMTAAYARGDLQITHALQRSVKK
jgi:hypothetical protein